MKAIIHSNETYFYIEILFFRKFIIIRNKIRVCSTSNCPTCNSRSERLKQDCIFNERHPSKPEWKNVLIQNSDRIQTTRMKLIIICLKLATPLVHARPADHTAHNDLAEPGQARTPICVLIAKSLHFELGYRFIDQLTFASSASTTFHFRLSNPHSWDNHYYPHLTK